MKPSYQRLESLDVLRGFDLFCLVALEGVLHPLGRAIDAPWYNDFFVVLLACAVGWVLFVGLGDAALHVYGGRVDAVRPFPI